MTAIALTAAYVASAAGGAISAGDAGRVFDGVSIDTRTLKPGELFVAIRGERFDGAEFAATAIDAGAGGVVVPRGWRAPDGRVPTVSGRGESGAPPTGAAVIEVDDTTVALQSLARTIRRASGAKVVAITGSAGKTTTKDVTSELLRTRYRVICNRGNFNNHIGLPLSLIDLRQRPEIAVVELGMNHAGEISTLVRTAEPDVRVWTNVGDAHAGFFPSVDAIADAKAEILEAARPADVLVANADDPRVAARTAAFLGRLLTFGMERPADVRASNIVDRGVDGMTAHVSTRRGEVEITTPLIGRANLANVLAATTVALEFDVPLADIVAKAATLRPSSHRGEVVHLAGGVTVIDDSYNANPTATRRALEVLAAARAARRVAVLGEMLELGEHAASLHAEVGAAAARTGVDLLFSIGGDASTALAEAAVAAGMARADVRHYAASDDAADEIVSAMREGDVVLVKGSRGVKTDRIVERLKAYAERR